MPSTAVTAQPAPTQVAPPATTVAAVPSPIVSNPSPSTQNSASAVAAARIDPGSLAQGDHPLAPTVPVAGILVAFGGTLIAVGGVVGLRRYPPL
ncbi:hypothetical protein GCM10023346_09290 [Arthrobacter gyeryongensis]|uniref:Uncharacterized protein n=2 Tax=Arthrobacter gyeryongensis TaxID=1650592 RepID=A0ABP9S3J1_9MICC